MVQVPVINAPEPISRYQDHVYDNMTQCISKVISMTKTGTRNTQTMLRQLLTLKEYTVHAVHMPNRFILTISDLRR